MNGDDRLFNGDESLYHRLIRKDSSTPNVIKMINILATHYKFDPSQHKQDVLGPSINHSRAHKLGMATAELVSNPIFSKKEGSELEVDVQDANAKFKELAQAVNTNDILEVQRLVDENSFLLTVKDDHENTILDRALSLKRIHIVRILALQHAPHSHLVSPSCLRLLALATLDTPLFEEAAVSIMVANLMEYEKSEIDNTFMRESKGPIKDLAFFLTNSEACAPLREGLSTVLSGSHAKCKKSHIDKGKLKKRERALLRGLKNIKNALLTMKEPLSPDSRLLWSIYKVMETRFADNPYFARAMFIDFLFLRLINPVLLNGPTDEDRTSSAKQLQIVANTHLEASKKAIHSIKAKEDFIERLEKIMRADLAKRLRNVTTKKFESEGLAKVWKEYSSDFVIKARKLLEEIFNASMPKSDGT